MGPKLANVLERLEDAFASEPIQRPHQHNIEAPARGILKQPPECFPISSFAGHVVFVNVDNFPLLTRCIFAQGDELVLSVLSTVLS